jgi:hypothetical protein
MACKSRASQGNQPAGKSARVIGKEAIHLDCNGEYGSK